MATTRLPQSLRAAWMRGGTSKGLFFLESDLPTNPAIRDRCILRALGSPDPQGMQLDGVGGGISSTSKVAVLRPSHRQGFDVDYTFGQVPLRTSQIDWDGSCGNLAAAVGLYAARNNLIKEEQQPLNTDSDMLTVRVWQENLAHAMAVHIPRVCQVRGDEPRPRLKDNQMVQIAGVAARGPKITVDFIDPNNGATVLPTGHPTDKLTLPNGGGSIDATLVLGANPTVIVRAHDIGLGLLFEDEAESPVISDATYTSLIAPVADALCQQGAEAMGIPFSAAVRLAWVASASDRKQYKTTGGVGTLVEGSEIDLIGRITTEGRVHHAFTGTGAVNVACAAEIKGTIPQQVSEMYSS